MEFWHVTNSVDFRLNYRIDWGEEDFKSSVSRGRTLRYGVRYTRKKLPVAFLVWPMFFSGPESLRQSRPRFQWCISVPDS